MITNNKIRDIIKRTLNVDNTLNESIVIQKKTFDIKTDYLSTDTIKNHEELYNQYVKDFNKVSAELDTAERVDVNSNDSRYRSLKVDETYNLNAAYLHELYFANIADASSNISMDSLAYMRLSRDFGTFDDWQKDFIACCMGSRCGWGNYIS